MVHTVLGPVDAKSLGYTLMHEHMLMLNHAMRFAFPNWLDEKRFMDTAVPQLKRIAALGIRAIIDATPINLGRDVKLIRALSEASGIHMIASTGLYHFESPHVSVTDAQWLADKFTEELTIGIQGTDIRAGVIKCATDEQGVTPCNKLMLEACAIACLRTNAPILTHTCAWLENGLAQQQVFQEMGVPLRKVVIGHSGDSNDLGYLTALMENGSYIGMDRFGLEQFNAIENRVDTIVKLVKRGWARRILLSHDSNFFDDFWRPWHINPYRPQHEGHNMRLITERVLPALCEKGVSQSDIDLMMRDNVARLFEE